MNRISVRIAVGPSLAEDRGNVVAAAPVLWETAQDPVRGDVVDASQDDDQLPVPVNHIVLGIDRPSGRSLPGSLPGCLLGGGLRLKRK